MARLPDRFDLWVRKARASTDPARQADWILGALVARLEVHFINIGTKANPLIAKTAMAMEECVLVFTDRDRIEDFIAGRPALVKVPENGPPIITTPTASALKWCVENKAGLMINPGGEETVMVPWRELSTFLEECRPRGERQAAGFWIPNMTTEEEDFWEQHGL